jgi:geranyl-CoA carboxylase beta subunit
MPVIESLIDTNSDEFRKNREDMLAAVGEFRAIERSVRDTAEKRRSRYEERGQIMPHERVSLLLDRGSPFLELMTLNGYKMFDDKDGSTCGGPISGIGYVEGVRCMITASNSAVAGGTTTPAGLKKALRLQQMALENKLPLIQLVESGGANLLHVTDSFVEGGRGFANQARLSAEGIPQVTVVHGSSTAGGAYIPGLSDYVIVVRNRAKIFLAGPPLLKSATGEIATDEELGGAEMHASIAGTAEFMAEDDADGIRLAREVMRKLPWNDQVAPEPKRDFAEPLYSPDELCGAVPADFTKPFDCREVIARIVDGSEFLEHKELYDQQTICGWAEIEGHPVGIISNNGPITTRGATKAAQFIQLCVQSKTPLVYLQNTTGYMVGRESEEGGIVKHGSKMIQAVANAGKYVPQITIEMAASFGAGNYGMCGRGFDPRFIFSWPNSRTAVMGPKQAAGVMRIVSEAKAERLGQEPDKEQLDAMERKIIDHMEHASHALYCTARSWDDGLIDPRDTRKVLAYTLSVCREGDRRKLSPVTFGVARL